MAERSVRGTGGTGMGGTGMTEPVPPPSTRELRQEARSTADMIKTGTGQVLDEAKQMVREAADGKRKEAAETVVGVAKALHRTAGSMETENKEMARYTKMAADRLDEVASYLRQANWGEIVESAENFARRQPYWFIGGMVATGFIAARLIKSSPETDRMAAAAKAKAQAAMAGAAETATLTAERLQ